MTEPMDDFHLGQLAQDVDDPIWPSRPVEPAVGAFPSGHSHEGLRVLDGALDLLHNVEDRVEDWVHHGMEGGVEHRPPRAYDRPIIIQVYDRAAKSWRGNTFYVNAETRIVTSRADRKRVTVTNWSTNPIYLSHESVAAGVNPEPNMLQLAANASRVFETCGEIYATPFTVGTAQQLDVQDEYGEPENN